MRGGWLFALGAVAVAGCVAPSPPAEPDLARPAAPKPAAAAPTTPAPPPLPVMAEVEMGGTLTRPPHTSGDATVWVVDAPCWQAGGRAFITTKTTADKFFVEAYVPQGTQIWVCAALGDGKKPMTIYGQADRSPLLGKGTGEVTFMGLVAPLKKGPPVTAPPKR
ncbi:MAG: hypothetical protein ACXVAN_00775 [Polyangia bacterium]